MSNVLTQPAPSAGLIAGDRGRRYRPGHALIAYRDLSPYRVQLVLEADGWHVDYDLKNPGWVGGGPHYVIDALTGTIVSKRYEQ